MEENSDNQNYWNQRNTGDFWAWNQDIFSEKQPKWCKNTALKTSMTLAVLWCLAVQKISFLELLKWNLWKFLKSGTCITCIVWKFSVTATTNMFTCQSRCRNAEYSKSCAIRKIFKRQSAYWIYRCPNQGNELILQAESLENCGSIQRYVNPQNDTI